jgi:hypothetical protein
MTAYDAAEWTDFFVAVAGASAALLGLLFVTVSINLERILAFEGLPDRALETLLFLAMVLVVSVVMLAPGQGTSVLGLEALWIGLGLLAIVVRLPIHVPDESGHERLQWKLNRWAIRLLGVVPVIVAGVSLLAESGGGLYWLVAGIVFSICGAVANAWVLLVEILR